MLANDVKPSVNASRSPDERRQLKHGPRQEKTSTARFAQPRMSSDPKQTGHFCSLMFLIFFTIKYAVVSNFTQRGGQTDADAHTLRLLARFGLH